MHKSGMMFLVHYEGSICKEVRIGDAEGYANSRIRPERLNVGCCRCVYNTSPKCIYHYSL